MSGVGQHLQPLWTFWYKLIVDDVVSEGLSIIVTAYREQICQAEKGYQPKSTMACVLFVTGSLLIFP